MTINITQACVYLCQNLLIYHNNTMKQPSKNLIHYTGCKLFCLVMYYCTLHGWMDLSEKQGYNPRKDLAIDLRSSGVVDLTHNVISVIASGFI